MIAHGRAAHAAATAALLSALLIVPGAAVAAERLTLAVSRGTVSLLVYVAEAQGYFQREGLQVQLLECSSGRNCVQELTKGRADVATGAELPVVLANQRGENLAILATIAVTSHQIKLVARASAGIALPADLRGKRVATVAGSSAQFYLASWLLFHDVDSAAVTMVDMEPAAMAQALAQRGVDAVAIWQPHAGAAAALLGADTVELPAPRVYTQHFVLAVQRGSDVLQPQATQAAHKSLLRALLQAQAYVAQQPQEAQRLLADKLGLSPAVAAAHLQEHDFRVRLDQLLLSTMSQQLRWSGAAGAQYNPLRWVDAVPLRAVAPRAVTFLPAEAAAPR